jgi:FtsH-binding integral membrane protein
MAFAQSDQFRPIPGAVATLGVSDRVAFLRRTYGLLGIALIAWAGITAGFFTFASQSSWGLSKWAFSGQWNWIGVLVLFMGIGWVAQRLASSDTSRGLQYAGLALAVVAEALILQPVIWIVFLRFGGIESQASLAQALNEGAHISGPAAQILGQAAGITLTIFVGLTAAVFITRKDFSFMRGALTIASFGALGVIIFSMIFGFSLGALFCGAMVLLMAGYILYQTSLVMQHFPPSHHVAAALMLFSTVATLFWYVLQLLMSLRSND